MNKLTGHQYHSETSLAPLAGFT